MASQQSMSADWRFENDEDQTILRGLTRLPLGKSASSEAGCSWVIEHVEGFKANLEYTIVPVSS